GVELQAHSRRPAGEGLVGEGPIRGGKLQGAARQLAALAVPLVDVVWKRPRPLPLWGGLQWVVAHLAPRLRVEADPGTQVQGQHLGAEANAEQWRLLLQRHADPLDLAQDEFVLVVGAHGAAEHHRPAVAGQRRRQRLAEARLADVEGKAVADQPLPHMAGLEFSWCRTISTGFFERER